ncbi:MAG: APC family permease [Pseudomonadota bacterium]
MVESARALGTFSLFSIGLGGMVGGGIFATTGLAVDLTRGAVPLAFIVAGVVALFTAYSYLKLTLRFPGEGGTVDFINRGMGTGVVGGTTNMLLCLSYIVLIAIYAHALGTYGASFFPPEDFIFWRHTLLSLALIALTLLNVFSAKAVIRSENTLNSIKMLILLGLIGVGLSQPLDLDRLQMDNYVGVLAIISGAMIVFFNYEGFELIANASGEVKNPERALPVAYIGGVLVVMFVYVLIAVVTVGQLSFAEISAASSYALTAVAQKLMGVSGHALIAVGAVIACGSAINATLYSAGRLTATISRTGEFPHEFARTFRGQPLEGVLLFAAAALCVANLLPLGAIATIGSAGFLFIFAAVNFTNFRLARETRSAAWISLLGALTCAGSLVILCLEVDENPATTVQMWIVFGIVFFSFLSQLLYSSWRKYRHHRLGI